MFDDYIIFIYFLVYCCDSICCYILYIILLFPKGFKFQPKNYYTLLIKDINFPLGIIHTIHIPLSLLLTDCIHISGGGWCQHGTTICVMLWSHCTTPADNMSQSVKSDRPSCRNCQCRPIPSPSSPSSISRVLSILLVSLHGSMEGTFPHCMCYNTARAYRSSFRWPLFCSSLLSLTQPWVYLSYICPALYPGCMCSLHSVAQDCFLLVFQFQKKRHCNALPKLFVSTLIKIGGIVAQERHALLLYFIHDFVFSKKYYCRDV